VSYLGPKSHCDPSDCHISSMYGIGCEDCCRTGDKHISHPDLNCMYAQDDPVCDPKDTAERIEMLVDQLLRADETLALAYEHIASFTDHHNPYDATTEMVLDLIKQKREHIDLLLR